MTPSIDPWPLVPGLVAVTGDERTGKTTLLRRLADGPAPAGKSDVEGGLWLDLALPDQDTLTPAQVWEGLQHRCPRWDAALHGELVDALSLRPHLGKQLFMLSAGSRRKVALAGVLAAGTRITCLDQPYVALDAASCGVIREFLIDAADHPSRSWVVADYEADPALPWRRTIALD